MSKLLELAARCEAAEGPDRELDIVLWRLFNPIGQTATPTQVPLPWDWHYTASLDAAMTLVPEDYRIASFGEEAYDDEPRPWAATLSARAGRFGAMGKYARAATPALALCAAALRARSNQGDQ